MATTGVVAGSTGGVGVLGRRAGATDSWTDRQVRRSELGEGDGVRRRTDHPDGAGDPESLQSWGFDVHRSDVLADVSGDAAGHRGADADGANPAGGTDTESHSGIR
ncbi:MAG TPA: hypothetical protein VIH10_19780 [Kribbella sp.]